MNIKSSGEGKKQNEMETLGKSEKADTGIKLKHKGGRPKKRIRRDREVKIRLTNTELFFVKSKAKEARMRMADWFRRAAITSKIVPLLSREDRELLHIITGMANNLNQLTKLAHTGGILIVAKRCDELLIQIDEAIQYFNRHDRKIPKPGKSFKGLLEYNLMKKEATILDADGIRIDKIAHTINDFNMQRKMNPNLGQAVGHIALSWSENDEPKLSDEVMTNIAKEYLQKIKISDTQVLIIRHKDKRHPHLHIIYNRVDNNGKTIPDNFQHIKNIKVSKELTLKYGFFMAENKKQVNRQQLKGADKVKYELFDTIKELSKQIKSLDELKQMLSIRGIDMVYKFKIGTKEIQGISFSKGEYKFKGSEIDRSLSFGRLTQAIEQNVRQQESQKTKQQQLAKEPKQIQAPIYTYPPDTGGKSLLEVLLEPDYIEPMPNIYDTEERKKKRKKKTDESPRISR